jgi:putative endopeptidase
LISTPRLYLVLPEIRVRWKRAISFVEGALGEAIGRIYVQRHFPEAAKTAMLELVDNLIEAYRISINELSWMSPETKAKALDKLGKFTPKIGYPDKWRDYSSLTITRDGLFGKHWPDHQVLARYRISQDR